MAYKNGDGWTKPGELIVSSSINGVNFLSFFKIQIYSFFKVIGTGNFKTSIDPSCQKTISPRWYRDFRCS